jgi:hypothetical protein
MPSLDLREDVKARPNGYRQQDGKHGKYEQTWRTQETIEPETPPITVASEVLASKVKRRGPWRDTTTTGRLGMRGAKSFVQLPGSSLSTLNVARLSDPIQPVRQAGLATTF